MVVVSSSDWEQHGAEAVEICPLGGQERIARGAARQLYAGRHDGEGAHLKIGIQFGELRQRHRRAAQERCYQDQARDLHWRMSIWESIVSIFMPVLSARVHMT